MDNKKKRKIAICVLAFSILYFVSLAGALIARVNTSTRSETFGNDASSNGVSPLKVDTGEERVPVETTSLKILSSQQQSLLASTHRQPYEASIPEEPMPIDSHFIKGPYGLGVAPLEIQTTGSDCHVVRLVNVKTGCIVLDYFIPAGHTREIRVPEGTYELRFTGGTKWYGPQKMFGSQASYSKADRNFSFSENRGYTVKLYTVPYGNLRTRTMNAEDF